MGLLLFNFRWMTLNIFLAILPIAIGFAALKVKNTFFKLLLLIIWFIFLPNAMYLFTDLLNLIHQWGMVNFNQKLVLLFQYGVLELFGLVTPILAIYPFEKYLVKTKKMKRKNVNTAIILLNIIVAFGITLGRVQRVNSWDVASRPLFVFIESAKIISSWELLALTVLFAFFINFYYFLFKKRILKFVSTYLNLTVS